MKYKDVSKNTENFESDQMNEQLFDTIIDMLDIINDVEFFHDLISQEKYEEITKNLVESLTDLTLKQKCRLDDYVLRYIHVEDLEILSKTKDSEIVKL